ncbi:MAG: D-alanine--D-alanine ligase [Cytophagaceae bacterium]|jgi:D-alanine-D-alanine ligase|nr:D-alanine--D-alanine ligase [Cytophagaceae bacterium]
MKKKIAVIYGGYSSEIVISRKSADGVCSFIDSTRYDIYPVLIEKDKWCAVIDNKEYPVSKEDFSFTVSDERIVPDCAYITIHGTPGEDGLLQGYLGMIGIPHTTCDVLPAALTFNKFVCNNYLKGFGINIANSALLRHGVSYDITDVAKKTGFPCFVKPNAGGSSFGVSKVMEIGTMEAAIAKAFDESSEVIVEQYIEGDEITCGLYKTSKKSEIFPLTMVVSENDFFDFEAKYTTGKAREITPAPISDAIAVNIRNTSSMIYDLLGCKGFVRIDYIVKRERIFLLEVNTTPGMTATSFIPQQIAAQHLDIKDVFSNIIEDAILMVND